MFTIITISAVIVTISGLILYVADETDFKLSRYASFILMVSIILFGATLTLFGVVGICIKGNVLMGILEKSHNVYVIEKNNKPTDVYLTYNDKEYHFEINESQK